MRKHLFSFVILALGVSACGSARASAPALQCWHVTLIESHEFAMEVRAKDEEAADALARAELRAHPTDYYYESEVRPASAVATRLGANPLEVCQ